MKPLSDKQAQAIMKLYPEMQWEQVRNLTAQEASQMISEKWGDSKPRNSAGWRREGNNSTTNVQNLPIKPVNAPNGARIGMAINNAVAILAPRFKTETTIESMMASIETMSREILKICDKLEKEQ